jgi:Fe2+ transport system protein FeoA
VYTLLVLGIVPGTDIQITFEAWLNMLVGIVALIIAAGIVNKIQPNSSFVVRNILPASQLHSRLSI